MIKFICEFYVAKENTIKKLICEAVVNGANFIVTPEVALESYKVIYERNYEKDAEKKKELTQKFYYVAEHRDG